MFGKCLLKKAVVFPQEMFPKRKMISFVKEHIGWASLTFVKYSPKKKGDPSLKDV